MKDNNDTITINQLIFILMLSMVGTGILTLPRNLSEVAEYDHWIVLLAGGLFALLAILVHSSIIKMKPDKHYFEILCDALTKPVAYIIAIVYVIYYTGIIGLLSRLFGEVIKVYLLVRTPIEVINITMLASCIYLCRKGVEVLGRLTEFLFPLIIVAVLLILSLSFSKAEVGNLLPVFEISFSKVLKGIPVTILSYIGMEMTLFFGGNLQDSKQSRRLVVAVVAVMVFYLIIVLATFAQFGPIQIKHLIWPTLDLFDTIELPGLFIENIQVVVMGLWVVTVFTTLAPLYLAGTVMAKSVTTSRDQAYLVAPFLPFIYFASIIPDSLAHLYDIAEKYNKYFASTVIFFIPLIVLISLLIQRKLRKGAKSSA